MYIPDYAHIVDGKEVPSGHGARLVIAEDPFTGKAIWQSSAADQALVDAAIGAARAAFPKWARLAAAERRSMVERFTELVKESSSDLAEVIAAEGGKPLWEARIEANAVITKFSASCEAYEQRATETSREVKGATSKTRYMPHGVMVVLSPFNFPASMGNSHVMPALLAGNTVVLKPSELTPLTGLLLTRLWQDAGLPPGVMNCLTGDRRTGSALVDHPGHDGVLFVGGHEAGRSILQSLGADPNRVLALELGGNSPLIVWDYDNLDAVAHLVIQSTFVSAGQRCTAARRLFVRDDDSALMAALVDKLSRVRIGHYLDEPEPYYGPLIRPASAERVATRTQELVIAGATPHILGERSGPQGTLISPTLLDMSLCTDDQDEEIFGPVLKVYPYSTLDDAIEQANNTSFGLAAGIVCRDVETFEDFRWKIRAGIVNWNQQLTGATTYAPFGGIKASGNFRPAGFHSVDYCSYPIASFEVTSPKVPSAVSPGLPF